MDIDIAINLLKTYKGRGATEILIARDFAPGGEFTLDYITPAGFAVVWINERPDAINAMIERTLGDYNTINQLLIETGYEYPRGAEGVKAVLDDLASVIKKHGEALDDITSLEQQIDEIKDEMQNREDPHY